MPASLAEASAATTRSPNPAALAAAELDPALSAALAHARDAVGLPLLCVGTDGTVLGGAPELLPVVPRAVRERLLNLPELLTIEVEAGWTFFAIPLIERAVAVGYVLTDRQTRPQDLVLAAAGENWSQAQLDAWLADRYCPGPVLRRLLDLTCERGQLLEEITQLVQHLDYTFEEISLLHNLTQNLQISRSPTELAELCLERMHGLIDSEGNAIWFDGPAGDDEFLMRGRLPFAPEAAGRLLARYNQHDWCRPLVRNNLNEAGEFAGLQNFVVVPIAEGVHRRGWIISANLSAGREFGTVEASLLSSVATILGTHVRNIELYREHDELLLSFVHSLVSTLDAKDPYTRGHSERVALIARRLGTELGLPEDQLESIYLSGLLHDIGKIGVDDQILSKPGRLTDEEFALIREHPMIGYSILEGLKNLQHVIPGVRHHHETFNGKGYPDGLEGDEIPLMARILAVADSYDAMSSDRPYRAGMPLEKLDEILQRGAGRQWDARVIDAYFAARDSIREICRDYSPNASRLGVQRQSQPGPRAQT